MLIFNYLFFFLFQKVNDFAKLTGDFISLSDTDKEVIALAYTLAEESGSS